MRIRFFAPLALLTLVSSWAGLAHASVIINGTRIIYPAGESEVTVRLNNNGQTPALVQTWLDDGDAEAKPGSIDVPFTITPPLFRINEGKSQTLRVMSASPQLPADKESIFWFNSLEIPPKPEATEASQNMIQIAFRTRIKFIYRPDGLPGKAAEAPANVKWTVKKNTKTYVVQAQNPTPYYVSYGSLKLISGSQTHDLENGMIAPFSSQTFATPATGLQSGARLDYQALNDYGGTIDGTTTLAVP